jgi:glutamate--cysteine ligase
MDFLQSVIKHKLTDLILAGNFGLEKENLRANPYGNLALTAHPAIFGDKAKHPYITTDFAESQIEMVTPPLESPKAALNFMQALHDIVSENLEDEYLWPYSLPAILPEDSSLIKEAQFSVPEITEYREYLSHKYGKRKQLLSGVHYNFSFNDKFMNLLYQTEHDSLSYREFRDQVYLKLARYYLKYCWLFIYLFGANSVMHESYVECCKIPKEKFNDDSYSFKGSSSFRNGVSGYRNLEYFYVSYNSLYDYIADINLAIESGHIIAAKEYYSQLRLKGHSKGNILEDLKHNGINYIEIRTLDLNPLVPLGITLDSLELIHLFMVYALIAPDFYLSDEEYRLTNNNQVLAANSDYTSGIMLHYDTKSTMRLEEWGVELLNDMYDKLSSIGIEADKLQVINTFNSKLKSKEANPASKIEQEIYKHGYANYFMQQAKHFFAQTKQRYYKFTGFEDLELSTQILLKEAVLNGVEFKFLDRQDNFIELHNKGEHRIIKQATKTEVDNYATILAMENKSVTKEFMQRYNIVVPNGYGYCTVDEAMVDYPLYMNKSIVIKPNSTNFGYGITIFKSRFTRTEYKTALTTAFSYDKKVLIEDFVCGKEYRFFVIDRYAVAVLHREAANVIGDGHKNISQLIVQKNSSPLRGVGYKTPLEKISLGEIEQTFLKHQGLSFDYIPVIGEKIFLRENSNISTGGDSIDFTDMMPQSYKRIAVKAAKSVGARICGVDMIIKNIQNPYPENNYAVIELNFNPAIHIHTYPYQGQDRKLARQILQLLKLI